MKAASPKFSFPRAELEAFCQRWRVTEISVFGSAVREDFRDESDIDLLVDFEPEARHTIFDGVAMEDELRELFNRDVDLVEKRAILASDNYLRRDHILGTAQVIYGDR